MLQNPNSPIASWPPPLKKRLISIVRIAVFLFPIAFLATTGEAAVVDSPYLKLEEIVVRSIPTSCRVKVLLDGGTVVCRLDCGAAEIVIRFPRVSKKKTPNDQQKIFIGSSETYSQSSLDRESSFASLLLNRLKAALEEDKLDYASAQNIRNIITLFTDKDISANAIRWML